MKRYLAVDIGASGGRHLLGWADKGKIELFEIYRFDNALSEKNGSLCWDIPSIFEHVLEGIARCAKLGFIPESIGIDTWGVDFVLLDKAGAVVGDTVSYRDSRTDGMDSEVERIVPREELYRRTGIQKLPFNSVYQLTALKKRNPEYLERAANLLMIPDYINYLLTGVMLTEYTNASTTSLLDAAGKDWDYELIDMLGFPRRIFGAVTKPGTLAGRLSKEIQKRTGMDCKVILPASHDTASAFMSAPARGEDSVYISSGTWSLLGIELKEPLITKRGMDANFTNEGGYDGRYRYLKNYMGLWMIQSVRGDLGKKYSYAELETMARESPEFSETVDVNDGAFTAPRNMTEAVGEVLAKNGKPRPETLGETLRCIYQSLALSYAGGIKNLEGITGRTFRGINIVGGGSKDGYLNELTAKAAGLEVTAGPAEATAIGNLIAQMIAGGEFAGLAEAREAVGNSFGKVSFR